jgi:hypothetical protein
VESALTASTRERLATTVASESPSVLESTSTTAPLSRSPSSALARLNSSETRRAGPSMFPGSTTDAGLSNWFLPTAAVVSFPTNERQSSVN